MTKADTFNKDWLWVIVITGLGFFIDSFDVFSYNIVRLASLTELGLSGDALTAAGIRVLNHQVIGSLAGGFFWGLLGDKIGRKKALVGSIIVYSIGMVLSSFVQNVDQYAIFRFIVGFGIAGEVGLGATLIGEILPKSKRTFGLAFFTILGLLGVATAAISSEFLNWRHLYLAGGLAGIVVLVLRHLLLESRLFLAMAHQNGFFQPLREIFTSRIHLRRYAACVMLLAPNFFVTGLLLTLSPELAKAAGVTEPVKASIMLACYFVTAAFGDLLGAFITQYTQSRRKAMMLFLLGNTVIGALYLHMPVSSAFALYMTAGLFGFFNVWALSATVAVEQFPTHLRATVSTSVLNFSRAMLVIFNLGFLAFKPLGTIYAASIVGAIIMAVGLISAYLMRETYHADLEKVEL